MDMNAKRSPVWILIGNRQGDNNQLVALAEALNEPYETKLVTYNRLRHIKWLRGERLFHLTADARRELVPPWPDIVIGLGYESIPVSRFIKRRSGGRTKLIQIGNPRTSIDDIDLVITTPQYPLAAKPNLLSLPFPIGNPARGVAATAEEEEWLKSFPSPRRLVAVGGSTRQWKIDDLELLRAIRHLQRQAVANGGSVIAVTSRRTTPRTKRFLQLQLNGEANACVDNFPRFAVLLARCDECHVTADSVSMLSEAILAGKPVGMIPISRSARGRIAHWIRRCGWNLRSNADLSRFWQNLTAKNLAGTVQAPKASNVSDTIETAVSAVRQATGRAQGI